MRYGNSQMQVNIPLTPMVKKIIIANAALWVVLIMILQKIFFTQPYIFEYFGLIPARFIGDFLLWQPFTYMFLHSTNFFHILFNMLIVWMFGSELEARWGSRFFLIYYLVSGVGAAFLYVFCTFTYYFFTNNAAPLLAPVIGASGATFGLILAYGIIFAERTILFMFIFPMKAKYFALLLGLIELMTLLDSGFSSQVANLAHLGGVVSGFLFLFFYSRWKSKGGRKKKGAGHGRRLKLVVDNESNDEKKGPRYWN